jgi:hypothetical protein
MPFFPWRWRFSTPIAPTSPSSIYASAYNARAGTKRGIDMDYLALAAVVIAVCSLATSVVSCGIQRRHNVLSVRPLGSIDVSDYENLIQVRVLNQGTGPLIVKSLVCSNEAGKTSSSLVKMLTDVDQDWNDFTEEVSSRVIPANDAIVLISITPEDEPTRLALRETLSKISITVTYEDIYKNETTKKRELSYFDRK